ncbi:MAG TPA: hypothetical protein VK137_03660 [Planctomycetaceae bacterium]|nr:hypothetical protein [Planctomycetaceae bacterium]
MQVATLVEPIGTRGFRAKAGSPFEITVEAESRQEAVRQLHECLRQRIAGGAELVPLEMEAAQNVWAEFAGDLKDDPLLDDWKRAMADYRAQVDRDQAES